MSKTILTEVDGWTPVIDDIVQEHGYVTALVFGVIWRHCQMRSGVCTASHSKLAERVGVSRKTISEHANKLVESEYLTSETSVGEVIVYTDTGKAGLLSVIKAKGTPVTVEVNPVTESNNPVTEVRTSNTINKTIKKHTPKRKRAPKHPLFNHPSILLVKEICGKKPDRVNLSGVVGILGDNPDRERLLDCYREWRKRDYRATNLNWIYEWYKLGIPGVFQKSAIRKATYLIQGGKRIPVWKYPDGREELRDE